MHSQQTHQRTPFACGAGRLQLLSRAGVTERFIERRVYDESIRYLTAEELNRTRSFGGPEGYYQELAAGAYSGLRFELYSSPTAIHQMACIGEILFHRNIEEATETTATWGQVQESDAELQANRIILHEHVIRDHTLFVPQESPSELRTIVEIDSLLNEAVTYNQLGTLYAGQKCFAVPGDNPKMLFFRGPGAPVLDSNSVKAVVLNRESDLTPFLSKMLSRKGIPTLLAYEVATF